MVILSMNYNRYFFYLLFLISPFIWSQNFQFDNFDRSKILFFNNAYSNSIASLRLSTNHDQNKLSVEYLILLSSLRNNQTGADKQLPFFLEQFPLSSLGSRLPFDLANFYFENQKYSYALKWYRSLKEDQFSNSLKNKFNFNKGYSLFHVKRYKAAKPFLEKVKNISKYQSDAFYYLGHISYQLDEYENAQNEFNKSNKESGQNDLAYFQVDMNFKLGRFQKAIDLGDDLIVNSNESIKSELYKIIGESYFNLKIYDKALTYLQKYKGKNGRWSNDDFYQLGYAFYSSKDYLNAIDQFNKIINKSNPLSQNAYYHLGDSYLKAEKKIEALSAFRTASEMNYDLKITEDALLQYAKLGYESGNPFESSQKVMVRFLSLFPKNNQANDIESILVSSYTQGGSYDEAISILESGGDYKDDIALQKVLYLKGIASYDSADYSTAQLLFTRAIRLNKTNKITAKSLFWRGQALFELGSFSAAQKSYDEYYKNINKNNFKLNKNFWYEIGYSYFKLGNYALAIDCFKKQVETINKMNSSYSLDTYLRLADSYFANSNYWAALENYNVSITMSNDNLSYAKFQKALSYGFIQKVESKIDVLIELTNNDQHHFLIDKSLYELAKTYAALKKYKEAIQAYDQLITRFPNSSFISRSYLNKGLILYNTEELNKSKNVLEIVVEKYKNDRIMSQALNTLKEIAIELGEVGVFSEWLRSQQIDSFSEGDLANSAFEAAEKYYFEKKNRQAERQIKDFIIRYPKYSGLTTLMYYLADISFQKNDWNNAITNYEYLIGLPEHEYTERSLVNAILAFQNLDKTDKLIPLLIKLIETASNEENKKFARYNLMRAYMDVDNFSESILLSKDILKEDNLDSNIRWDALEIYARSALIQKDSSTAYKIFKELENSPKKILAVEARFLKAYRFSQLEKYDLSNDVIAELSKVYGNSHIWSARSILLMAKNFKNLNDYFQSTYLLETLIENFDKYPQIINEAKKLLIEVKEKASDKNSSVQSNIIANE